MKTEITPIETCPHCGSEKDAFHRDHEYYQSYKCKTWKTITLTGRTELCREREARQKAEAELEKVTDQKNKVIDILDDAIADLHANECSGSAHRHQSRLNTLEGKL